MTDGLTNLAQSLGITQITAAQMKGATDVVVQADKDFNAARSAQQAAYDEFRPADAALSEWLGKATAAFSTFFGKRWSKDWVQAGFTSPSIAIPSTISDRLALALRIITFLTANPTYEAPTLGVTAANGTTLRKAAITTQGAAVAADQDVENKGDARQVAVNALTSKMRLLIGILAELLNPDDTRWLDFGLEMPGKLTTPAAPTGVSVAISPASSATDAADPNTVDVLVTCDAAPFATRYRFRMRIAGLLGSNYELMASTTEPMAQIAVPAGATLEFIVQAVNGNRQSVASEAVVFTAPMAALKSAAKPADATAAIEQITPAAAPASDGHANGNRLPALS